MRSFLLFAKEHKPSVRGNREISEYDCCFSRLVLLRDFLEKIPQHAQSRNQHQQGFHREMTNSLRKTKIQM